MNKLILALALLFTGVACAGPNNASKNNASSNSSIVEMTESNYDSLTKSQSPVVIDVYADWCMPCKNFATVFAKGNKDLGSKYQFAKLNIDKIGNKAAPLKIGSIPAILFIKNGKEVGRHVGAMSEETFRSELKKYFGS